jgi:translation initiation factor 1
MEERSTLVYVSGEGRIKETTTKPQPPVGDGVVRLSLKKLGGNKSVTIVSGLSLEEENLKQLCSELKRKCATGGTVKNWTIEIQGDRRELIKQTLEKQGYKVKLSGG